MPRYEFIKVETWNGKTKPTGSVRSHAIRAGLRKSGTHSRTGGRLQLRLPTRLRGGLISPETEAVEYEGSDSRSVLDVSVENSIRPPTYHVESVGAGRVDPFDSLPIPSNLEIDHLVKYLITKFDISLASVHRGKAWFPYALQSAPMMHGTLAMAAAVWRAEYPVLERSIQIEGIRQKGEAMRLIRAHLALVNSVTDEAFTFVMSTMSTLVIVEVLDGDFEAAETHLRGVYSLFTSRGGSDNFKDEWIFCKSTNLADIQVAVALGRQLIFPRLYLDQGYLPETPESPAGHAQHQPLNCSITDRSSHECVAIFIQIRQLLSARQLTTGSPETFRVPPAALDELILRYLYRDCVDDVSDSRRRSYALVLAAHIFMYVTLRQAPPKSPLVHRMCIRLQGAVGITPPARQLWAENEAALLWIAFVGLLGTGERAETCPAGQSFLYLFRSVVERYPSDSPQGADSLHEMLSAFLWDESYCRPLLRWLDDHQLIGQT
ncbi:uncharacterized protein F4807DRAFT_214794 [Annulohypoxylon truncatum]|uniref:uncharacterized protein n=1 Tax=Annulohypoxylon truncatum TaxID=327061 RepID=UPI00200856EB|nr:uncharacterized protein F4807DRAFT_214794 [Annulohypoxylon truncatum]KAI1206787.1 hypothetical protein F4807DRAFT_214794 [Annulohypoxylon truncatum]